MYACKSHLRQSICVHRSRARAGARATKEYFAIIGGGGFRVSRERHVGLGRNKSGTTYLGEMGRNVRAAGAGRLPCCFRVGAACGAVIM